MIIDRWFQEINSRRLSFIKESENFKIFSQSENDLKKMKAGYVDLLTRSRIKKDFVTMLEDGEKL